ncbi:response receiver [Citrifermentans bemidjiense Bem]|uniref:Response receiver n=1 Tax=Citrifermentans bemidjiense (strain ATCC BAA-1014 / DSM 16622 / JCM 12645 / Bem) TaxID=404380 RepID=B5E9D9_CITBB|nr:response regulator [Citrifermentans bemidjiense]ACH38681.1 response receiver [Citrifermentans bemidjiense Bem]
MTAENRKKILLVDDDKFFQKVMSDAFESAGFTVATAGDGQAGVEAYAQDRFDAVVLDLVMPRMGGVSASLEIARLSEDPDPVLILLTSMFQGAPHEHPIPEMGAKVHIPKSTPPLDIVIIVEQLLERKRRGSSAA